MRLQTTQEMSFMSHSHITSEERYTRSLRHSVMQNSGFRVNKDHSNSNTAHARNITPHGVSSRGGRNFLKADLTPVTLKSPGTAQHKSPLAPPKPPLHPEPSELEECRPVPVWPSAVRSRAYSSTPPLSNARETRCHAPSTYAGLRPISSDDAPCPPCPYSSHLYAAS